jgi:uncharacterized protein (TIGR02231 family)
MKTSSLPRGICSLMVGLLALLPSAAGAEPVEVTLFPTTARVVEITRVNLQAVGRDVYRAVVHLPAQTLPESLTASLETESPLKITDQSWRQVSRQDDARLAELRRQLLQARTERIGVVSGIHSLDAQIQFWQAQAKARVKTTEETVSLSALIGKSVKKAYQDKLSLEPDLEKLDKKIKELQEEFNRITGQKETLWEVNFLISGPQARQATLRVAYLLAGCGWSPLYRLDARPHDGLIQFNWEAEIWQSSGADWNQVDTKLATLQPDSAITPPDLPAWIVRPRPEPRPKARPRAELMEMAKASKAMAAEAPDAAPHEVRQGTYAVWEIGKRTIPAGSRQRMHIREEVWKADFVHLLRPSLTPQGFVQASVKFPEGTEIPRGAATFLIDGAVLGKRPFSFSGQEGSFSFGADPLVTATAVLLSQKSGERGFMTDRQIQEWAWRVDILNSRNTPVRARLEEPLPQSRDERIKLSFKQDPEPSEQTPQAMIWNLEVPPGQKRSVLSTVLLEAPKGMDLDLGWRQ